MGAVRCGAGFESALDLFALDRMVNALKHSEMRVYEAISRALIGTANGLADADAHRKMRDAGRVFAAKATELEKAL